MRLREFAGSVVSIEAAGAFTVLIALLAILPGPDFALATVVALTLFGAAAAILMVGSGCVSSLRI